MLLVPQLQKHQIEVHMRGHPLHVFVSLEYYFFNPDQSACLTTPAAFSTMA